MRKIVIAATSSTEDMLNAFESKLNSLRSDSVESSEKISCSETMDWLDSSINWEDWTEDDYEQIWEKIERKQVQDSDGFYTDYTLWYNVLTDEWCTVFGDNDLYKPWNADHDMDFESNEQEARDWFDDYNGFADDEEIY